MCVCVFWFFVFKYSFPFPFLFLFSFLNLQCIICDNYGACFTLFYSCVILKIDTTSNFSKLRGAQPAVFHVT